MLCYLLVCVGHRCENHVREFAKNVKFDNVLKIVSKHPQVYWNPYILLIEGLDPGQ